MQICSNVKETHGEVDTFVLVGFSLVVVVTIVKEKVVQTFLVISLNIHQKLGIMNRNMMAT